MPYENCNPLLKPQWLQGTPRGKPYNVFCQSVGKAAAAVSSSINCPLAYLTHERWSSIYDESVSESVL